MAYGQPPPPDEDVVSDLPGGGWNPNPQLGKEGLDELDPMGAAYGSKLGMVGPALGAGLMGDRKSVV